MEESAFHQGVRDARQDILSESCRLFWQTRGNWGELFRRLMQDRFHIQVIHVSDITSEAKSSYEMGYNDTIKSHVNERFGPTAFDEALSEIEEYRQETYLRWLAEGDQNHRT